MLTIAAVAQEVTPQACPTPEGVYITTEWVFYFIGIGMVLSLIKGFCQGVWEGLKESLGGWL